MIKKITTLALAITLLLGNFIPVFANTDTEFDNVVTPTGLTLEEMTEQINNLMNEHVGSSTPGSAIVVVHEGEIIFSQGYGWADIENQVPVDPATTVFEYGSTSKLFVWLSVMQLVEQDLLDLDEAISYYLPSDLMALFDFEYMFTMRDLLNHTAGFGEHVLDIFFDMSEVQNHMTLREALVLTQPIQIYEPGTVSAYTNFGTALTAYIVGYVSGQDYVDFERENIFLSANMQNTLNQPDWFGNHAFLENSAQGHMSTGNGNFQTGMWTYTSIYPAGAVSGTAYDLAHLIKALTPETGTYSPLFENQETLATIFTPSSLSDISGTYHGLMRYTGVLPTFSHGGNTPSFSTSFVVVPEMRFGFVLLTNVDSETELNIDLANLLLGNTMDEVPTVASDNLPNAETVAGHFLLSNKIEGNLLEFINYFEMFTVNALDENTIELLTPRNGSAVFRQVEPYVFHMVSVDGSFPPLHFLMSELRFQMEDGSPVQIHIGNGFDLVSLPTGRTIPFLITSLALVILSVAFFLVTPIVLVVAFLKNRKKQTVRTLFDHFTTGFLLSGTLFALNFFVLFIRYGANPYRSVTEIAPHIWFNYIAVALSILLFSGTIWTWRKTEQITTKRKVFFIVTTVLATLFIFVLHNWNFFTLL